MELRDLRYFETIAELEHLGRASRQLHRSQPALTSSIRRLESECGVPLFERAGRGIRLTSAGTVLLRWARRTRFDVEDARREIAAIGQGLVGEVRIGIVPTAAQFLLPPVAREFLREAPDVVLRTVVGLVDALRPRLHAGELDLMVATESDPGAGFASTVLAEDPIVVAASRDHPLVGTRATLRDLTRHAWALQPPGAPTRDWLDHTFVRARLPPPRVQVESTMLLMLPELIAETDLLSFLSRRHLETSRLGNRLHEIPVRAATMRRRLVLTHRTGGYLSPAVARLVELLVAATTVRTARLSRAAR